MKALKLESIVVDGGTQFRAATNDAKVTEYAGLFSESKGWPFSTPCEVFFDGLSYYLVDGFHRYFGAKRAERKELECNVRNGTLRDAIKFALSANAKHGLHRSNDDKRKAVLFALDDSEWGKLSNRLLAEMCGVSEFLVRDIRGSIKSHLEEKETRLGKDGKQQPASKPKPAKSSPETHQDVWEDVEDDPEPVKPTKPLPKTVMSQSPQELVASIHAAGETLLTLIKEVNRLSDQVGGEWIDCQEVETRAKALRKLIRGFAHWIDCPKCKGKGCDECKRRGWLSVERKQYLSQEMKDLLEVA